MKTIVKHFLMINILFAASTTLIAQTLTSIVPDNAKQGESLAVTITGQNTNFLQGSSTTVMSVWFSQGSSTINASSFWANSKTLLSANFNIPSGVSTGSWNVKVADTVDGTLTLPNGFTVNPKLIPTLTSIVPNNARQGESLAVTITGQNTNFLQGSSTTVTSVWFLQGSSTINASSFWANSNTSLSANFNIPSGASTGSYDVKVADPIDGTLTLPNGFTVNPQPTPALISIVPNSARQGESLAVTITGQNTNFLQGSSTTVTNVWFSQGSSTINAGSFWPNNQTSLSADFDIPSGAPTGSYDVKVADPVDGTLTLPNGFTVNPSTPVILVHGFHGNPAIWNVLRSKLEANGINYYIFDYSPATGDPRDYAHRLKEWVKKIRTDTGYAGKFDIVCHSMGAMVSRMYMEKMDGANNIRQWIGLAPVNNGAAIADWWLAHLIYPGEKAVDQMTIKSPSLAWLNYNISQFDINIWGLPQQLSPNIIYRNMIGIQDPNIHNPAGKTYVAKKDYTKQKLYSYWTYFGDNTVAMEQSMLQGNNVGNEVFVGRTHTGITTDLNVINKIISYLINPSQELVNNCPQPDSSDDHYVSATDNKGYILQKENKEVNFLVDSSAQKALIMTNWQGSDVNMTLITPSGTILEPNVGGVEYGKTDTKVCYEINVPEVGEWTAVIEAVNVPVEGEPFEFMTFYSSPLTLDVTTSENKTYYHRDDAVSIIAKCADGNDVITGSVITATVLLPGLVTEDLLLYDDGSHGDANANDGYYSNNYLLLEEGTYQITVTAQGIYQGTAFERTMPVALWVTSKADLNYDTKIDFYDFAIFAGQWMQTQCSDPNWCGDADIDHSGDVGFVDLMIIAQNWFKSVVPIPGDITGDGKVDLDDLKILAEQWLQPPGVPSADIAPLPPDGIVNFLDFAVIADHWLEGK